MFRRLSIFSKNLFKDNGIDRKTISESKRKDIFSTSDSSDLSSTSSNEVLENKTKKESSVKKANIQTLDWKTNNPNIKGKSSISTSRRKKISNSSKSNSSDSDAYISHSSKKDNDIKVTKKDKKHETVVEKKSNIIKKENEPCKSHYENRLEKIEEGGSGIKNAFNNFINRRRTMLFDNRSSLKEFQESLSNESSGQTLTNNNNVSSSSSSSSSIDIPSKKIVNSSREESLKIKKKKEEKSSVESLRKKFNEASKKNNNDNSSNFNSFLRPPSIFKKSNFNFRISRNSKNLKSNNSKDTNKMDVDHNDKIIRKRNSYDSNKSKNSSNLPEPTTPNSKPVLQNKLEKSPGSNEIERLKMIFMNCTQKLQNSEDITNDISAFYKELSKLENVLDSPSRKKNDDQISKPTRKSSKVFQKPVIPPPPPPPPMLFTSTSKTSGLQDVLAYNKNSLKTKKKQIVNKDLVPNSNFIDQLIEEFKSKTNKKNEVRINTNVKRTGPGISPHSNESPVYKPFLRHVRRPDSDNSIKKYKPSKIDFRKNLRTASRDPEFQRNLMNELGSSTKRKSSYDSGNRRYTMAYIPSYKETTTTTASTQDNANKSKIPIPVNKIHSVSDSEEMFDHPLIDNKKHTQQTKHKSDKLHPSPEKDVEMEEDIVNDDNISQKDEDEEMTINEESDEKVKSKIIPTSSKKIFESIKERPKISPDMINQKLKNLNKTDKEAVNKKTLLDTDGINFDSQTNVEIDTTSLFSNSTYSRVCKIKQSFEQNSLSRISNNNFKRKDSIVRIKERKQSIRRRRLSSPRKLSFNLYNGYNYNYIKKQPYRRYSDSFDLKKLPKISYHIKRSNSLHHPKIKDKNNDTDDSEMVTARLSLSPTSSAKLSLPNNSSSVLSQAIKTEPESMNTQSTTLRASPEPEFLPMQIEPNDDSILEEDESIIEPNEDSILEEDESIIEPNEESIIEEDESIIESNEDSILEEDESIIEPNEESIIEEDESIIEPNEESIIEEDENIIEPNEESIIEEDESIIEPNEESIIEEDENKIEPNEESIIEEDERVIEPNEESIIEENENNIDDKNIIEKRKVLNDYYEKDDDIDNEDNEDNIEQNEDNINETKEDVESEEENSVKNEKDSVINHVRNSEYEEESVEEHRENSNDEKNNEEEEEEMIKQENIDYESEEEVNEYKNKIYNNITKRVKKENYVEEDEKEKTEKIQNTNLSKVKIEPDHLKQKIIKTENFKDEIVKNNSDSFQGFDYQDPIANMSFKKENQISNSHEHSEEYPSALAYIKQEYDDEDSISDVKQEPDTMEMPTVKTEADYCSKDAQYTDGYYTKGMVKSETMYPNINESLYNAGYYTNEMVDPQGIYSHDALYHNNSYLNGIGETEEKYYPDEVNAHEAMYANGYYPNDLYTTVDHSNSHGRIKVENDPYHDVMIQKKRNLSQTSFDYDLRKKRKDNENKSVLVLNPGTSSKIMK